MIATLVKQPGEVLRLAIAFATTRPIVAVQAATVVARGLVPAAPPLRIEAGIATGAVVASLADGGDGERYAVTLRVRDADGAELESELDVLVIETLWQTPEGGTPLLSIAAFIARFGLAEVIAMTDADGSGRIDRDLLVEALTDAQAIAESYLAGRYALPLATVPRVIAMGIADLARARLYPRGAPEGVDANAKAATRLLENIAAGRMALGLPAADIVAAPPSDAPVMFAGGRRQYPDGLADY